MEQYLLRTRNASEKYLDRGFKYFVALTASLVAFVLFAIFATIFTGSIPSITKYGIDFLITSDWNPVNDNYGAFAAISGTIVSSLFAIAIAVPLAVGTAIYITEDILPFKIRYAIGLIIELLAAIPSVVLGLWAIFILEPFIRPFLILLNHYFSWLPIFSTKPIGPGMAPAILILVIMILPIITSISRDSLNQVPHNLKEACYGIGATRWSTIFNVQIPAALSGIAGGVLLALGRAMGETMAVTMIIGNSNTFSWSILAPGNTISSMLANQFGEADGGQVSSLMYAALVLMILTLLVNVFAQLIVKKLSLKY